MDNSTNQKMGQVVAPSPQGFAAANPKGKVDAKHQTAAVVLAGGSGSRFGVDAGKQLVEIAGKPLLSWSLLAFDAVGDIGLIVVVCPEDRMEEYRTIAIEPLHLVTPVLLAPAGESRQESAFAGLEYVPEEYEFVALHDGARPLITEGLVGHAISELKGNLDADGVILATPAVDTLKLVENGEVSGTPDRKVFWNAQTPQIFRAGLVRRAYAAALSDGFYGTDDSTLIERLGGHVFVVEGKRDNIKLTVPEDHRMLETALLALRSDEMA